MMRPPLKVFFFPAAAIGFLIAIFFFRIYGPLSRPEVPTPISASIDHFAPGVGIGKSVAASGKLLSKLTYIKHIGFVGSPLASGEIKQVRLILSPRDRSMSTANEQARVEAVEMFATRSYSRGEVLKELSIVFRGMPKIGCISPTREGMPYRDVEYWTTKNDRGGIALISDWNVDTKPKPDTMAAAYQRALEMQQQGFHVDLPKQPVYTGPPPVIWSLLFWSGPFRGQYTIRGDFEAKPCATVAPK